MRTRSGRGAAAAAVVALWLAGPPPGAAQSAAGTNAYSDELQRLPPEEQARRLANYVGFGCIGSKPFLMGVTQTGAAKGYAYWSIECAGAGNYAIQLDPDGEGSVIDCRTLAQNGRECFKKF